ncbi:hypothetical protein ACIBKZ_15605 [Streptomyces sp. NPDC050421]|uniref:hypothetical protein n=1 Tax=Streptomyces sp. NPDC050421 TaxID=3365613 RepID=UPI00379EEF31
MASKINALPPSLTGELNDLKKRLASLERRPEPVARFDRYPTSEWAARGRGKVTNNAWSSCGIANVTGLVYDRLECKFYTDWFIKGRSEGELRLAAFRHYGNTSKVCVSASSAFRIHGNATRSTGTGVMRWKHGIPFGWDYQNGEATYTVELQHRYLKGPTADKPDRVKLFGYSIPEGKAVPTKGGGLAVDPGSEYQTAVLGGSNMGNVSAGWTLVGDPYDLDPWDGSYAVSNMHYCVGLPADRLEMTGDVWAWFNGGESSWGAAGNPADPTY